jgi:hypothetical protein
MTDDVVRNRTTLGAEAGRGELGGANLAASGSAGQGRMVQAHVALDWRDPKHFARRRMPCRVCKNPTFLRDNQGRPCDKTCAEKELAAEIVRQQGAYFTDERTTRTGGGS